MCHPTSKQSLALSTTLFLSFLIQSSILVRSSAAEYTCEAPAPSVIKSADGFIRGRTTYYGGPDVLSTTYDAARGKGSFGILTYGSCGYTPSDGTLPFPRDAVAAASNCNKDYPGVCGRCYQVRCVPGIVYESDNKPVTIVNGYYGGDKFRPYLPSINPGLKDTMGRSWPGNPLDAEGEQSVQCWDDNQVLTVRVIDECPCNQVLPVGAPGDGGGTTRKQEWCCGSQNHFDLSYWAFEKLAHPVYGVMTIEYKPVDCDSQTPLQFSPGYVSKYMFRDGVQAGWDWSPYKASKSTIKQAAGAPSGNAATCVTVSSNGGLSFRDREGDTPGYQPFKSCTSIDFWIKSNSNSVSAYDSSTPSGQVPPLQVLVSNDEKKLFCLSKNVKLADLTPLEQQGEWFHISIPMSAFNCNKYPGLDKLDRFDIQNPNALDAAFCIADLQIV